jgi:hypothetical protein
MILGVNTDVRHKGKTFHIQTEDSGITNPVLITHVFIGGTIIATTRSSYEDVLEQEDLEKQLQGMMRAQHRATHEALKAGEFDEAAKTARGRKKKGAIPLAKNRGPVGVMAKAGALTISAPPPDQSVDAFEDGAIEELDADEIELVEEPLDPERPMTRPPAPPSQALVGTETEQPVLELEALPDNEDSGLVEYSTDLVSGRPLDPVLVAWLLEDEAPS